MSILTAIALASAATTAPAADSAPATRQPVATSARASVRVSRAERIDFSEGQRRTTERAQVRRERNGSVQIDFR
ncbi:MAG: hypothetical protein ABJM58_10265 [Alteripontixanthobacter sp.]